MAQAGVMLLLAQQPGTPAKVHDRVRARAERMPGPQPDRPRPQRGVVLGPLDVAALLLHHPARLALEATRQVVAEAGEIGIADVVSKRRFLLARRVQAVELALGEAGRV